MTYPVPKEIMEFWGKTKKVSILDEADACTVYWDSTHDDRVNTSNILAFVFSPVSERNTVYMFNNEWHQEKDMLRVINLLPFT